MSQSTADLKRDLALAGRILALEGHGDSIMGIVAARVPGSERFWIKSMGYGLDELTPERLIEMDLKGQVFGPDLPVHSEWHLFAELFRARPDVGGIVHTHAPYACMLSAAERDIEPYDQFGVFHKSIRWYRGAPNRINTPELGREVAEALGDGDALMMKHHGIVTVGPDIRIAALSATFLEKAARRQILNEQVQGARPIEPAQAEELRRSTPFERMLPNIWSYYERRLQAEPGPAGNGSGGTHAF